MDNFNNKTMGREITKLKDAWTKGTCLHPSAPYHCNGKPINSHSLQRSRVLTAIADDSHIFHFRADLGALCRSIDLDKINGNFRHDLLSAMTAANAFQPLRLGIRNASVFPGFCGNHDHDTFAPIEERELVFDDEQCFLLNYRPTCMELWAQRAKIETLSTDIGGETALNDCNSASAAAWLGLEENGKRKVEMDALLLSSNYDQVRALILKLDANPSVACTGVFAPEVDFADVPLQNIHDLSTPLERVSFSIIPSLKGGHAIIGWYGENLIAESFVHSLLSLGKREWPDAILRVAFESIENTYFSPLWWAKLTDNQKEQIGLRAIMGGIEYKPISYKPDGICIAKFSAAILRHPLNFSTSQYEQRS